MGRETGLECLVYIKGQPAQASYQLSPALRWRTGEEARQLELASSCSELSVDVAEPDGDHRHVVLPGSGGEVVQLTTSST